MLKCLFVLLTLTPTILFSGNINIDSIIYNFPDDLVLNENIILENQDSTIVELTSKIELSNNSEDDISTMYLHLTTPATNNDYQILLSINATGYEKIELKNHKNQIDSYLQFTFPLQAKTIHNIIVTFKLLLIPVDYNFVVNKIKEFKKNETESIYTEPSKYIESDANEIKILANNIVKSSNNLIEQTKLAYKLPWKLLRFEVQKQPLGALKSYLLGKGDCTEFAALYCAINRSLNIPSRLYSVFSFGKDTSRTWQTPNHTISEIYLNEIGWIPIDPNLGQGKFANQHSFGKTTNNIIYFNHENTWVWGIHIPEKNLNRKKIKSNIKWNGKIISYGKPHELFHKFKLQNKYD